MSDLNGDGLDDVVQAYLSNGQLVIQPLMSNGRSLEIQSAQSFNILNLGTALPTLLPMEVNGDGLPDLVVAHGVNHQLSLNVLLSTGSGYTQPATINQPAQVLFANLLPMDFNGDGKTDLVMASRAQTLTLTPVPSNTQFPDLMTTITNGLGGSYSITYKPLTDATVYSKGGDGVEESVEARGVFSTAVSGVSYQISSTFSSTAATAGASYATRRVRFPKYVAAAYTKNDGRGGAYTYQQFYTGALVDLTGRGWLGYESVSTSDLSTGTTTLVAYNQLFPLSHFTSSSTLMKSATDSAPALLLLKTSLGYDPVESGPNTGPGIYQARQTSMQTDFYTYAGLDSSTPDCSFVKTFSNFDAYGNSQLIAHTGNALAAELYVSKTYENDPTRWRIGYEVSSRATADSGGMQVLSWTQATYLLNMSVHTSSLWHDQTKQFLTTTYGYDQFGNRTSIHSPNGRVTNMVFEPAYHTYLQQKTEVVGSKSLVSSFAYYPESGELQSHTDENNVTFSQQLDGLGRVVGKTGPNPSGATVQFMTRAWETEETGVYEQMNRLVDLNWSHPSWSMAP